MFELQREDIKIIELIDNLIVCILDFFTSYGSSLTIIRLPVVLCVPHEPAYKLKAAIVCCRHLVKQLLLVGFKLFYHVLQTYTQLVNMENKVCFSILNILSYKS